MQIENKTVELRILKPSKKSNWLTNGEGFFKKVSLGKDANADDWREITNKEYEKAMAEQESI